MKRLLKSNYVVVPTDKTNSVKTVELDFYIKWVTEHLKSVAIPWSRESLKKIYDNAMDIGSYGRIYFPRWIDFLYKTIETKAITQKLWIKDHKKPDKNGVYPSWLVVLETKFTAGFPKLGYLEIENIFNERKVCYDKQTIVQPSNLKENWEIINLKKNE